MANPQKENGYTPIANEILEQLTKTNLHSSERRVVDVVLRKTYGFNKKEDAISLSQFADATGLGKRSVIYAIQNLEARNIIKVTKKDYESNTYCFNKDYDSWVVQRNSEQYDQMLVQKRKKYHSDVVQRKKEKGSAENGKVVQRIRKSSAENTSKVVQRIAKKHVISAHTKDKSNKRNTKGGKAPVKPVQIEPIDPKKIEEARHIRDIIEAFSFINPAMKRGYANTAQRLACVDLMELLGFERTMFVVTHTLPQTNKIAYMPTITTPHQLFLKWAELEAAVHKAKNKVETKQAEKGRGLV